MYREEWLNKAVDELRPIFKKAGVPVPKKVRVSVGFPGGRGPKNGIIGQCWTPESVKDKVPAVFVSPVLNDPVEALKTLTHELVHATGQRGHRKDFSTLAAKVGLDKPWKSTTATTEFREWLKDLAKRLGKYDHSAINSSDRGPKQTTRLIKVVCPDCGYTIRVTQKWIDEGFTSCPDGTEMTYG